jgi:hypothetical protein
MRPTRRRRKKEVFVSRFLFLTSKSPYKGGPLTFKAVGPTARHLAGTVKDRRCGANTEASCAGAADARARRAAIAKMKAEGTRTSDQCHPRLPTTRGQFTISA